MKQRYLVYKIFHGKASPPLQEFMKKKKDQLEVTVWFFLEFVPLVKPLFLFVLPTPGNQYQTQHMNS